MAAAALFFSLMSVCVKLAGRGLPTLEIVLARGVVLWGLTHLAVRRRGISVRGTRRDLLLLRGFLGLVATVFFYLGVVKLPLAEVTVIHYTNPVWTGLLAALFLGERLRPSEGLAVAASLGGVVLMTRPTLLFGGSAPALDPLWVGVALAGALLSSGAYVTVRRLGATEDPLIVVWWFAMVTTVGSLPVALPGLRWPTPGEWALLAGVGASTQVAQVFMTRGLREVRAGRAMAVGYLQILFAALWGLLLFGERPDLLAGLGALLVMAGTWVVAVGGGGSDGVHRPRERRNRRGTHRAGDRGQDPEASDAEGQGASSPSQSA